MNKGIVMEINESNIIVMTSSGRFDKLPRAGRSCEVGEEILYADTVARRRKVPPIAIASGLVAAAVLCFVLISALQATTANSEVVAYVSIDINPSIEMGIDSNEIVRDLRGINADGIALIAALEFKGKNLVEVTSAILDKAEQGALAKGEGDIVISSTFVGDKATLNDEAIADKLRIQVAKHIESAHPTQVKNYEVTAFAAPIEVRNEAKISGVTAGKYAVYLNALSNGTQITIDEIQNKSIHQWAKDNGGMSTLVDPVKPITKSALKVLVDEEKSGKLTEKVQEKEKDKNKNNNNKINDNNKNNDKNGSKNNQDDKNNQTGSKNNQNDKNSQNGKPNPTSNKSSPLSDFLLNRGNDNTKNNTNIGNINNDINKNDSTNGKDNNMNKDNTTNNNKSDSNKKDNNNSDSNKNDSNNNGNNQKGGSATDKPGASLKPSPSNTPSPTPRQRDGNDSRSDGSRDKNQQDNKKQGDSKQSDNKE